MTAIHGTLIGVSIDVLGAQHEVEAAVRYVLHPAERGSRERGGRKLEPDCRESAEILGVYYAPKGEKERDIMFLLTSKQLDAIESEIMEMEGV